jgi:hypothetical protein
MLLYFTLNDKIVYLKNNKMQEYEVFLIDLLTLYPGSVKRNT